MFEKVRSELPDCLYGVVTFAYFTGWREAEIVGLRWNQVDLAHGEVRLDPGTTKNGAGHTLFLEGELREMLERLWEKRQGGCEYVFARTGRSVGDFKKAWASACRRAGCPEMLFHDLRRTAVRNMVRAGIPERVAMRITGHKTRAILDRYHIVSAADLREAVWKLAAWNGAVHADATADGDKSGYIPSGEQPSRDAKVF
jgi:integrase